MRKLIAILLCLMLLILSGCSANTATKKEKDNPTVVMPDSKTSATVNGYKQPSSESSVDKSEAPISKEEPQTVDKIETPENSTGYYANKSSKKFHSTNCSYAKNIKSENLYIAESRDELINEGYTPCKKCNP